MRYDKKRMEHIVLIGVSAALIFVCSTLIHEGIQIVAQEQNGLSEAIAGRIETNPTVGEMTSRIREETEQALKADIHNPLIKTSPAMQEEQMNGIEKKRPSEVCKASGGQKRGCEETDMIGEGEAVCLPTDKIVRGFGWQEDGGVWRYHAGVDFLAEGGSDVCAVSGGTVRRIKRGAGGCLIEVAAQDRLWIYEPLETVSVAVGDQVRIGACLGRTAVSGDRLHIACRRDSEWLDPQTAMQENRQKQPRHSE